MNPPKFISPWYKPLVGDDMKFEQAKQNSLIDKRRLNLLLDQWDSNFSDVHWKRFKGQWLFDYVDLTDVGFATGIVRRFAGRTTIRISFSCYFHSARTFVQFCNYLNGNCLQGDRDKEALIFCCLLTVLIYSPIGHFFIWKAGKEWNWMQSTKCKWEWDMQLIILYWVLSKSQRSKIFWAPDNQSKLKFETRISFSK